jgi:hypothetical protein
MACSFVLFQVVIAVGDMQATEIGYCLESATAKEQLSRVGRDNAGQNADPLNECQRTCVCVCVNAWY